MVVREMSFQPVHDSSELQDFDDAEETLSLSLSDLPINGDASDWDDFSKEDQSLGSCFDQDFFEFFSEDFTASTYPKDEIIFCGKLITCKGETVAEKTQNLESTKKAGNTKKGFIFPWKPSSFNKSSRTTSSKQLQEKSGKTLQEHLSENHGFATRKCDDTYGFSMKPRWYFLALGVGRLPMEMELSDIKMRQSRKRPSRMFQSEKGDGVREGKDRGVSSGFWGATFNIPVPRPRHHLGAHQLEMSFQPVHDSSELQDFDDAEETLSLSLSDLPINGDASDWDDFSKEDQSLGSCFDQDFFEFFSEDFTASTYPKDEIIFCGKLITCKGETVAEKTQNLESTKKAGNTKKGFIFPWKPSSFNKSSRTTSSKQLQEKSGKTLQEHLSENHGFATRKCDDTYGFSMKPRWYFLALGVGRLPMEMELSDIKMRQSRKRPSRMFQSEKGDGVREGKDRGVSSGFWGATFNIPVPRPRHHLGAHQLCEWSAESWQHAFNRDLGMTKGQELFNQRRIAFEILFPGNA
ncbi:hypothetical protein SADUNF_Sadunf16G0310500 [Salix dunnii]|uniref:Uncharacterized protein n=1 Tax=Salix dunnii TaxID=1413687 RepID=A0A835MI14_9ROSI|nr:hypothetical protein SADUNF_Sadunf16G0310500 [Salix dunnii]